MVSEDVVAFLVVIMLGAWLGHQAMAIDAALAVVRARIRSVKTAERRFKARLDKLDEEEKKLTEELATQTRDLEDAHRERRAAEQTLAATQADKRQRLFILGQRRATGDRDWVVRLVNDEATGAPPPLATEWQNGRDYLVWAKSEPEALQLAVRRFGSRARGIRAVAAEPGNLFLDR